MVMNMELNEIIVVGILATIIILPLCAIVGMIDEASDPTTDPNSGNEYANEIPAHDYSADEPTSTQKEHDPVDISDGAATPVET